MKKRKHIIATLLLMALLASTLFLTTLHYYTAARNMCLDRLYNYSQQTAEQVKIRFNESQDYLERIADILAKIDVDDQNTTAQVLRTLQNVEVLSHLELLLPGDRLMSASGRVIGVSDRLSFQQLSAAGPHISKPCTDPLYPGVPILRICVPVVQGGETVGVLCGVVNLITLDRHFISDSQWTDVQLYMLSAADQQCLMDTQTDPLYGNGRVLDGCSFKLGYDIEQIYADFSGLRAGSTVFYAQSENAWFYTYYAPVGLEDWILTVTVPEKAAFADAKATLIPFYCLAGLLAFAFLLYLAWLLWDVSRERKKNLRQLEDVQYILATEKELFRAHSDPAKFISALKQVAQRLTAEGTFFWMSEQLLDGSQRVWCSSDPPDVVRHADLRNRFSELIQVMQQEGRLLSYHLPESLRVSANDTFPISEVHNVMLVKVADPNGTLLGVLGGYNMTNHWKDTTALDLVAPSFAAALDQFSNYQSVVRMGQMDTLTGLLNRNSYNAALNRLKEQPGPSLVCLYLDANGLHELNNTLGHDEGDQMLITVAQALLNHFPVGCVYRIGGDEFVVLCPGISKRAAQHRAQLVKAQVHNAGYEVSMGMMWQSDEFDVSHMVTAAEQAMQNDKRLFYAANGGKRQPRES